jgi:hypothetical protein
MRLAPTCCVLSLLGLGCPNKGVIIEVPAGQKEKHPGMNDPPPEMLLSLLGPFENLDSICKRLEMDARRSSMAAADEYRFECRTDVSLEDRELPGLNKDDLGPPWEAVRFLKTGPVTYGFSGELRLAIHVQSGWYFSDAVIEYREDATPHEFLRLELQSIPLAAGRGKEVFGVVRHEWGREYTEGEIDAATMFREEMTVLCTTKEANPHCMAIRTEQRQLEINYTGMGSGRKREILADNGVKGTLSFPENGVFELQYPDHAPSDLARLAGQYRW